MSELGIVSLTESGRLERSTKQVKIDQYEALEKNDFAQLEEIAYWIQTCKNRGVKPSTLGRYIGTMRDAFNRTKTRPRSILPQLNEDAPAVFGSRKTAIEFASNLNALFVAEGIYAETPQSYRVSLRNLYDCYGLSFGHGMARQFKLGSHHDRFQPFKGAHIPLAVFNKISQDLFEAGEFLVYVWFNVAVMTGARTGGVATMTWDRIKMSATDFSVEQHETKDHTAKHAGKDKHLGEFGEGVDRAIKPGQGHGLAWTSGGAPNVTVAVSKEGDVIGTLSTGQFGGGLTRSVQYPLPAGDNILRVKVVVASNPLTFSLGVIKVFN